MLPWSRGRQQTQHPTVSKTTAGEQSSQKRQLEDNLLQNDSWRTISHTHTHQGFSTQTLLHTHFQICKQMLSHTDAFTHRRFYTHKRLYTQTPLLKDAFTHRRFYIQMHLADAFTHRRFYIHTHTHTASTHTARRPTLIASEKAARHNRKPQFYLSFWRSTLTSWERLAIDASLDGTAPALREKKN